MCAQYTLRTESKKLAELFHIPIEHIPCEIIDKHIFPHLPGLVFTRSGLEHMNYSLVPSWSKVPRPKFATYNARTEDIENKPAFKYSFIHQHCIVPISTFIEPIYEGEYGGNMVGFADEGHILCAAGIWSNWTDKQTGEVLHSYAILTQEASPYIARIGHDRSPIFLNPQDMTTWTQNEGESAEKLKEFLQRHRVIHTRLSVSRVRPLKTRLD